ncbi:unnamed protein product [Oncorhynchus mykiss]|uniref:Endonuclease/exonuclease/phosphatase domain-containing protein n=1 Tax=Oncorhynchus mykiss TaxID=8022 RepID=A0A060W8E5_ONCMY|nr:unnamed protein product [Oncorhynchus mykiss]
MLNTPAVLQSKLGALNLTQIIKEPTRYNPKSVNMVTLIDIILTNLPSKYTSAVFNQDLSDHCLIACIRYGSAVKRPPLITVKHFSEKAFLIDLAQVSWKDIDIILSVEDAWSFFKSNFLTILDKHAPFKKCRTKNRYSPWFTPDLTVLDQHNNILWQTAIASNSPRDMQLFREVRNQYTQSVRKAKAATRPSLPCFSFTQIQIADVLKELQNLDPYKSAELDNLDPLFLKLSAAIVATPITSLFNLSFVSSEIPKDWKAAAVIPLFKGRHTLDPNCYRPISILPCLSKGLRKPSQQNRSLTISNPTVPSPLCNPVSEPVTGAPQPCSRY